MRPPNHNKSYQQISKDIAWKESANITEIRLRVISDSMAPYLHIGDYVYAEPVAPRCIKCGDVVVVRRQGEFITHRLVKADADIWYTKGDRFRRLDPPISPKDIVGRVFAIERRDTRIDLRKQRWIFINRCLGVFGLLEVRFFGILRQIRKIFQSYL